MSEKAKEARAVEIADGVWQLAHWLAPDVPVHVHLVRGDYGVLIDSGIASTYPLIERAFFGSGVTGPRDVRIVLNTHGHHDHIGSNAQVKAATGALIAAPAGAVPWIEDHARHLREFLFHHPDVIADTPELREEIGSTMDAPVRVDLAIGEGFAISPGRGLRLEAIALPGHVPAELGYFERASGTLILGDAVTRADMPFFQGHVLPAAYRQTLAKLRSLVHTLPIRQVAPAHYPLMDAPAFVNLLGRMERHLDEVDALVALHVRGADGSTSLQAIWQRVCAAAGKQPEFRSLAMVEAHLQELMARGQIKRAAPDQYVWIGG